MEYLYLGLPVAVLIILVFIYLRYLRNRAVINETINDRVVLKIEVPRRNEKTPLAAEQMFASLHGILRNASFSTDHFSFEIASGSYGIYFLVVMNQAYQKFFEGQIYAQYPDANITSVKDYAVNTINRYSVYVAAAELSLEKEYFLPIRTFMNFEVDPLAAITSAMSGLNGQDQAWVQILVRPVANFWQNAGKEYVSKKKNAKKNIVENGIEKSVAVPLESGEQEELLQIETKNKKLGFIVKIRILSLAKDQFTAETHLNDIVSSFKQFQTGHMNSFVQKKQSTKLKDKLKFYNSNSPEHTLSPIEKYAYRFLSEKTLDVLNTEEIASVFHLPNISVETQNIAWASARRLQYPLNLPIKEDDTHSGTGNTKIRFFAYTDYHGNAIPFGMKKEDRRRHMYILGKTGTGKSSLMKNMIISDILDGDGICLIDPHGQDIEDILDYIPPERVNDVIYIDPSDLNYPIGFNLLELKSDEQRDLVADGVVEVFKKHFDSWGPRLQYILHNTILTMLFAQNTTLLGIQRILRDKNYRKFILKQVKDPILLKFWTEEYEDMQKNTKLLTEAIAPIQNKIGRFLSSSMIRNIVGQVKSTIDLEDIMNNKKILLVNLSQGKIGEENTALLGGMLITRLQSTALQRGNIPESERNDFYLYVDEFQNFATTAFAKILSEARKYRLNLVIAHQYIAQLSEEVRDSIFGNVGSMATFVVGPQDASTMQKEFAPFVVEDDLVSLEKYHMITKMMIDGEQSKPFTAVSMPNTHKKYYLKDQIIENNRLKYAKNREEVEDKISRWSEGVYNNNGNLIPKAQLEKMQANQTKQIQQNKGQTSNNKNQNHSKGFQNGNKENLNINSNSSTDEELEEKKDLLPPFTSIDEINPSIIEEPTELQTNIQGLNNEKKED